MCLWIPQIPWLSLRPPLAIATGTCTVISSIGQVLQFQPISFSSKPLLPKVQLQMRICLNTELGVLIEFLMLNSIGCSILDWLSMAWVELVVTAAQLIAGCQCCEIVMPSSLLKGLTGRCSWWTTWNTLWSWVATKWTSLSTAVCYMVLMLALNHSLTHCIAYGGEHHCFLVCHEMLCFLFMGQIRLWAPGQI